MGFTGSSPRASTATWRGWRTRPERRSDPRVDVAAGALRRHARRELRPRPRSHGRSRHPRSRRDLGLCPGRRLSRRHQEAPQAPGALAHRAGRRRREGVRRHRGRDGKAAGRRRGHRLAGQAHQPGVAPVRLVAVSRRDLHHPRSAARSGRSRSLRDLPGVSRRLPDRGVPRAVPPRCAALHLLPHHRAQGPDPARTAPADRQPHLRLRRLPRGVPMEQVRKPGSREPSSPPASRCRRRRWPISPGSTMPASAACSPAPPSSAPGATVSCATC